MTIYSFGDVMLWEGQEAPIEQTIKIKFNSTDYIYIIVCLDEVGNPAYTKVFVTNISGDDFKYKSRVFIDRYRFYTKEGLPLLL